jgi:hypothetical protein
VSVEASSWAWKQPVKGNAKLVLLALADHADRDGICWPGQKGVAEKCGISERTVRDALGSLECDGYVEREARVRDDGGQAANRYRLRMGDPPADSAAPPAKGRQGPPADLAGAPRQNGVARVEPSFRTNQKEPSPTAQLVRDELVQVASKRGVSAPSVESIERRSTSSLTAITPPLPATSPSGLSTATADAGSRWRSRTRTATS